VGLVFTAGMKRNTICILTALVGSVLWQTAVAADKPQGEAGTGKSFKGPIGLQLYSLRDQFKKDVPGSLDKTRDFGFKYVELAGTYDNPPEKFKQMLADRGLVPISAHYSYARWKQPAEVEKIAAEAKVLGLKYVGCAWIDHKDAFDEQECREAISVFNKAGEVLAKHGLKFFYHTHGYEFEPYGKGTLFDLMMEETKPAWVSYQMDVLWVVFPSQDPTALLKKYDNRWALMHLKDLKKGVKTGSLSGGTDVANNVVLGTGQVIWPEVLKAAKKAGVKYYFVEDESPSVLEQMPQHLKYLEQVKF
jgi:sugar phosphate isomerase/epimerase